MSPKQSISSEESISSMDGSIAELVHRVLGVLNLSDASQMKSSFEDLRSELMTKVSAQPFQTLVQVAGVGFVLTQLLTFGRANTLRWFARGAGTFAVSHLLEKISSAEIDSNQTRH